MGLRLRLSLSQMVLLSVAIWACACGPIDEESARMHIQDAKRAISEDKIDEAKDILKLVPRNSKAWSAEGKVLKESLDNPDAIYIRKAKEALSSGKLDDAKKYLKRYNQILLMGRRKAYPN